MNQEELISQIVRAYQQTKYLKTYIEKYSKIIILGNGGSNSVASHIAQDYTKVLKKRAITFSDPSRLTCYINDYGMANAYQQFVSEFADQDTLVVLISSSGNSENMLRTAQYCGERFLPTIVLTGFDPDNKLRNFDFPSRLLEFWVDSKDYGVVECTHLVFLHSVLGEE